MKQEYLKNIKDNWYKNISSDDSTILTGDMDGLFSTTLIQKLFGCKASTFFDSDFTNLYKTTNPTEKVKPTIGVDLSLTGDGERCFSNHCIRPSRYWRTNNNDINLNNLFDVYAGHKQYHKKYCGSTFVMLLSLYNIDLSVLSEDARILILCLDSTYKSFFSEYENDNKACKFFLCEVLELTELYETLEMHKREEFEEVKRRYKLDSVITIDENGKLQTECNLFEISLVMGFKIFDWIELPKEKFILEKTYKTGFGAVNVVCALLLEGKSIISLACTSKYYSNFSFE